MKTHGIGTTGAYFWGNLFPEANSFYWFPVAAFEPWVKRNKHCEVFGHSKDGSASGRGFKLPKDAPFVLQTKVPARMVAEFDWPRGTDRQRGQWGEEIIYWMLLMGLIRPPVWAVRQLKTQVEQFEWGDFELTFMPRPTFEVKTEGAEYAGSLNLFIQTAEGGHKPNLVRIGNSIVENVTSLPRFER